MSDETAGKKMAVPDFRLRAVGLGHALNDYFTEMVEGVIKAHPELSREVAEATVLRSLLQPSLLAAVRVCQGVPRATLDAIMVEVDGEFFRLTDARMMRSARRPKFFDT